jgi:hypothetical protein
MKGKSVFYIYIDKGRIVIKPVKTEETKEENTIYFNLYPEKSSGGSNT